MFGKIFKCTKVHKHLAVYNFYHNCFFIFFFPLDLNTYYANLEFSNLDGDGEVEVRLQQDGSQDTLLEVPVNAVVGHVLQQTSDQKPKAVKITAKEKESSVPILTDEITYRDEPSPIYIALGKEDNALRKSYSFISSLHSAFD